MWPFLVMCGTMGYLFHVWGGVGVGLSFFFVISICTELLFLFHKNVNILYHMKTLG